MFQKDVLDFINSHKFNPSKKMGQNFLINDNIPTNIVDKIDFSGVDCVIEIGPGLGALTDYLIEKHANVTAIELDKRLFEYLQKKYKGKSIKLINDDVLRVDFQKLIGNAKKAIIVSNLPYSISSLVVVKFIKETNLKTMYCMLQKEMAEKLTATPSTKQYNSFSVLANYYCDVIKLMNVGPNNFFPIPEVESIVIKIDKTSCREYDKKFDSFLKVAFSSKRKTILNNLKNKYNNSRAKETLIKLELDQMVRAEAINVDKLHELYKEMKKYDDQNSACQN